MLVSLSYRQGRKYLYMIIQVRYLHIAPNLPTYLTYGLMYVCMYVCRDVCLIKAIMRIAKRQRF